MTLEIHKDTGNIFRDTGHPDPDEAALRSALLSRIGELIEAQGYSQKDVARILRIKQPEASNLMRGKLSRFSRERLVNFMVALGADVEIVVKKTTRKTRPPVPGQGSLRVVMAG